MKSFVLAGGLGMVRAGVGDAYTEPDKPCTKAGVGFIRHVAPGWTIVGDDLLGQPIPPEGGDEVLLYRFTVLSRTGEEANQEA